MVTDRYLQLMSEKPDMAN